MNYNAFNALSYVWITLLFLFLFKECISIVVKTRIYNNIVNIVALIE